MPNTATDPFISGYDPRIGEPTPPAGDDNFTDTSWRPSRKFIAGLLTALALFCYDAATSGVGREDLAQILPLVSVLVAFYAVPDSK